MFESMDINDMLRKGRQKKNDGDEDDGEKGKRKPEFNRPEDSGKPPTDEEIANVLEEKFGMRVEAVRGGVIMGEPTSKNARLKHEGMMESLIYIAESLNLPPTCKDANGVELTQGDVLKVPGGEIKTVLKVGWKFALLSRIEDQAMSDGAWFENQINELNFIRKN